MDPLFSNDADSAFAVTDGATTDEAYITLKRESLE